MHGLDPKLDSSVILENDHLTLFQKGRESNQIHILLGS